MEMYDRSEERTGFQTHNAYSPDIDIQTDFVMVYGFSSDIEQRIRSWREKGYRVHLMTGILWGGYQDYLEGKYDGIKHWDEAQTDENGKPILHGVGSPYMVTTLSFIKYLTEHLKTAVDAGVFDIHLEEPEFFAKGGYSEAFKREWEIYYRTPWEAPNSGVDAQYKASKLKRFLLTRAISYISTELKYYAKTRYEQNLKFYVPTHSLINYCCWNIISPESALMDIESNDGYIAQIWTGTSRVPNMYDGNLKERTFLTAFLEYGIMQELTRGSDRRMWFLHDPIEDTPSYGWDDYKYNYIRTLVASLLHGDIHTYEVCPWINRIFNQKYPRNMPGVDAKPIPEKYKTTLLTVMNVLRDMKQDDCSWETPNEPIGVLISDTALYQRIYPKNDPYGTAYADAISSFSCFYGMALPLLQRGIPVVPVQLENVVRFAGYLKKYRMLLLSYEFMKPQTPAMHYALLEWVRNGGVLIYVGDGSDSFNSVKEWWNTGSCRYASPAEHLFEACGLTSKVRSLRHKLKRSSQISRVLLMEGIYGVGKGCFALYNENPSLCAREKEYAHFLRKLVYSAGEKVGLSFNVSNGFVLDRGPYKIVSVLNEDNRENMPLNGYFADLLSSELETESFIVAEPGDCLLLYDIDKIQGNAPRIVAVSARAEAINSTENSLAFTAKSPAKMLCACRLYCPGNAEITLNGKPVEYTRDENGKTVYFSFPGGNANRIELSVKD